MEMLVSSELVSSFMQFITPTEANHILSFSKGQLTQHQPIMDILSDYSIFSLPTKDNVMKLVEKVAKVALIRMPCFALQNIVKGFWTNHC